jgi:hypothetical protein
MAQLRYIGKKPTKTDTVAGTATVWLGHGDVQSVPDALAPLFWEHPTVWEVVEMVEAEPVQDMQTMQDEPKKTLPPGGEPVLPSTFSHQEQAQGSVFCLRAADGTVIDLANMKNDGDLKMFARQHGIAADLRKRGDELRASITAAVIHATSATQSNPQT